MPEAGEALAEEAAERIEEVELAIAGDPRPRVAALEWLDPVFIGGHWVPQMIELAGGEDVLGMPGEKSRTAEWAELEAAAPEIVISMPCGYYAEQAAAETMLHRERLAVLGARVVAVDAAAYFSRPGPRLVDGIELLGHILHPDVFEAPPTRRSIELDLGRPARGLAAAGDDDRARHRGRAERAAERASAADSGSRARSPRSNSTNATSPPPISPPMWPPIEMFGTVKVITQVEHDPDAESALHQAQPAVARVDGGRRHQPEDRARGSDGEAVRLEQKRSERAAQERHEVDQREAHAPDRRLQHRAEDPEREHVEEQVEEAGVQEARRDDAPVLPVGHRRARERSVGQQRAAADPSAAGGASPAERGRRGTRSR